MSEEGWQDPAPVGEQVELEEDGSEPVHGGAQDVLDGGGLEPDLEGAPHALEVTPAYRSIGDGRVNCIMMKLVLWHSTMDGSLAKLAVRNTTSESLMGSRGLPVAAVSSALPFPGCLVSCPFRATLMSSGHRVEVVDLVSLGDESGSVSSGESVYWKEWSDVGAGISLVLGPPWTRIISRLGCRVP